MANRWGIPKEIEEIVRERDTSCVYCGIEFKTGEDSRKRKPSWEHIINDIRINGIDNIALCCMSCNASKGSKLLEDWLKSDYCKKNNITVDSVDEVVKMAIKKPPRLKNN
ncbi:hypothetical protein SAMN05444285_13754 [Draconibacterium orientale]|uniref:HNH endonuclease n=1 Tax=Draconibacterium orientale TaxID=1168034 RepID=X5DX85_9BACT|nr:hypothetical protein [Draconibacterium orientale]AHW58871.1 hypothetical protein FH5T_02720 [Draconibacterium orientale]SEU04742.1 hypothetical protein SAMN05444285_13754 [Draconibacterium orientale]